MLSSGSSPFVASPAPSQRPPGLGSACRGGASAPPPSSSGFAHRFQEFCFVSALFLLPLGHVKLCDSFELQGSLLDLLVGVHAAHFWIRISKRTKVWGWFSEMEIGTISFSSVDPRGFCVWGNTNEHR